jgi:peroxiredoxin
MIGVVLIAVGAIVTPPSATDQPTPAKSAIVSKDEQERAARIRGLREEVDSALLRWMELDRAREQGAAPRDKLDAAWKELTQKWKSNGPKVIELVSLDPKSDASFRALEWIVIDPINTLGPSGLRAVELLRDYHTRNPKIGYVCGALEIWNWNKKPVMEFLRAVATHNPDRVARGNATLSLAWLTDKKAQAFERKMKNEASSVALEAESLFKTVVADYSECPRQLRFRGLRARRTLGDLARKELFELHLAKGKVAPEIDGEDLDKKKFKLSDYRGKVVVLDFWGHWSDSCRAMYANERSLVERLKDKPFVLLGVNSDKDRAKLKEVLQKEKITWRSFWDGGSSDGPIANAWNVYTWPTIYVLDHKGVVRFRTAFLEPNGVIRFERAVVNQKDVTRFSKERNKTLDEAVDQLMKSAEAAHEKSS